MGYYHTRPLNLEGGEGLNEFFPQGGQFGKGEDTRRTKMCPLSLANNEPDVTPCREGLCAWWADGACAMVRIAKSLTERR